MRFRSFRWITLLTSVAVAVGACSSGGTDNTSPKTGSISIALSGSTLSLVQGANGTVNVTVTRAEGFTGDVTVAVEGLPTGVTASSITIPASQTVGSLTLTAGATATVATATLTVRATGSGVSAATAPLSLTVTALAAGGFTLSLSPTSLSIVQGASGATTITIGRTAPFTGAVGLAVTGAPTGLTPTLSASSVTDGSATLTLAATSSLAVGTSTLTINGTGAGVSNQSVSLSVTITAAATGGFTLSIAPTSFSVAQGSSGQATITLTRTAPFTGAVALAVTGAPSNVTPTLSVSSIPSGSTSATITVAIGASATAGTSNLTITGTASGVSNQVLTLPVTVTSSGGGSPTTGNITYRFCGNSGLPIFVASQDGTGAWTRVIGNSGNDTFSFPISTRGSIAFITSVGGGFDWQIYSGTVAELLAHGTALCFGTVGAGKSVTAPVSNAGGTDLVLATLGRSVATVAGGTSASFANVLSGTVDLIGSRSTATINGTTVSYTLSRLLTRRGLNPAAGSALTAIDFNGGESFAPVSRNLTITGISGENTIVNGAYTTSNNTLAVYFTDINASTTSPRSFPTFPAANQSAGDLHVVIASALSSLVGTPDTRVAGIIFNASADKTVALGSALSTPTVSVLGTTGYVRLRSTWAQQPAEYGRAFTANWQQAGSVPRAVTMNQTADFAGATTVFDIPDLTALSGFNPTWGFVTGTAVTWTMTGQGWSTSFEGFGSNYTDGGTFKSATKAGTITP